MIDVRRSRAAAWLVLAAALAASASGCSVVPRTRLDDCARQSQGLQAEVVQLRDTTARLRGQNRDLAQRAVDDARRLRALEEANGRLEQSVAAYQQDIGRMEAEFDAIKREVQLAADAPPAATARRP